MATGLLCMILGSGFLAHPDFPINPEAAAAAGAAVAVRAQAAPGTLTIVVEGAAQDALRQIAERAAGADAAEALSATECPPDGGRIIVVDLAGRDPAESGFQSGILWAPDQIDAGGGPAPEVARGLRELLGIAVPRPMAPWNRRVSLLRLPATVPVDTLLAASFQSPWTSWIAFGADIFLVSEDPEQVIGLMDTEAAERVVDDVELGTLRIIGPTLPEGARALSSSSSEQLALCPAGCDDGDGWLDRRFTRVDTGAGAD